MQVILVSNHYLCLLFDRIGLELGLIARVFFVRFMQLKDSEMAVIRSLSILLIEGSSILRAIIFLF